MTYRLRTLGGLALDGETGSQRATARGAASQRRTLALLALIAAAGERGIARDKLLGYLWPESEPERARHTLTQSLYTLRRDLKADALFQGTSELKLNRDLVSVDVLELDAALDRGDLEAAVALYGGPFLDGFFLGNAPEFERWVDGERGRLAARVSQALESLAGRAAERGAHREAVDHWRRIAALDPYSGRIALGLMRALAAAGDRAGALQHARVHETLLKEELELAPDHEIARLAEQLREPAAAPPPTPAPAQVAATAATLPPPAASAVAAAPMRESVGLLRRSSTALGAALHRRTAPIRLLTGNTLHATHVAAAELAMEARARRRRLVRYGVGAAAALVAVVAALWLLSRGGQHAGATAASPASLAVVPLESPASDTAANRLAERMSDALTERLALLPALRVKSQGAVLSARASLPPERGAADAPAADPGALGRLLGVRYVVEVSVRPAGARARLTVRLVDADSGFQLWGESYEAAASELPQLGERVARDVAGRVK